jgi:hypothetical protein
MYRPVEPHEHTNYLQSYDVQWGRAVNSIWNAHKPYTRQIPSLNHPDAGSRGESVGRAGDVSVTAIEFLPGREHLLISASEADCSIMLWDIRSIHPKRKGQYPLSHTKRSKATAIGETSVSTAQPQHGWESDLQSLQRQHSLRLLDLPSDPGQLARTVTYKSRALSATRYTRRTRTNLRLSTPTTACLILLRQVCNPKSQEMANARC